MRKTRALTCSSHLHCLALGRSFGRLLASFGAACDLLGRPLGTPRSLRGALSGCMWVDKGALRLLKWPRTGLLRCIWVFFGCPSPLLERSSALLRRSVLALGESWGTSLRVGAASCCLECVKHEKNTCLDLFITYPLPCPRALFWDALGVILGCLRPPWATFGQPEVTSGCLVGVHVGR